MHSFRFSMNDKVSLNLSGESGVVIGRAEHLNAEDQYLLRYKTADGRQVESWWGDSALKAAA